MGIFFKSLMSLFLTFGFFFLHAETVNNPPSKKTVCLNMIVKNESSIITRCLESTIPIIDYWVIVDTGSNDGTQEIVKNFMKEKGVPGELHERPWVNFAHNRNQALELAKGKADYALFMDADDYLGYEPDFKLPNLDKDYYYIHISRGGQKYARIHLVDLKGDWEYKGVIHEAILSSPEYTSDTLEKIYDISTPEGSRSKNPQKYFEDAQILEAALLEEPDNSRYVFYLAQSYRDAEKYDLALKNYERRAQMPGWYEENFWTYLEIARCQEALKMPDEEVVASYQRAFAYRNTRIEPLYYISRIYRNRNEYKTAYQIIKMALETPITQDTLFIQQWMRDWALLLELSVNAYMLGDYEECRQLSLSLLKQNDLPPNVQTCVTSNLGFANSKILEQICQDLLKPEEVVKEGVAKKG